MGRCSSGCALLSRKRLSRADEPRTGRGQRLALGDRIGELTRYVRCVPGLALRFERSGESVQGPAVHRVPPQIFTVDALGFRRCARLQELGTQQMPRRKEPVVGLIVG